MKQADLMDMFKKTSKSVSYSKFFSYEDIIKHRKGT